MRVVIQRVKRAHVQVDHQVVGSIHHGMVILVGVEEADNDDDVSWLAQKIVGLRIFSDEHGKMNKDILEVSGNILLISQFTLHAATKKGNRPSFIRAARPEYAQRLYQKLGEALEISLKHPLQYGVFGAMMDVELVNDGPVTIWIDSKAKE